MLWQAPERLGTPETAPKNHAKPQTHHEQCALWRSSAEWSKVAEPFDERWPIHFTHAIFMSAGMEGMAEVGGLDPGVAEVVPAEVGGLDSGVAVVGVEAQVAQPTMRQRCLCRYKRRSRSPYGFLLIHSHDILCRPNVRRHFR